MPWNGSGSFARLFSWVADKAAAINITASRVDSDENDIISNGLGNCLTRDGQGVPTATLPMAGFRHLNIANSQARNEYLATGQFQDATPIWGGTSTGAANVYAVTHTPAITALVAGMRGFFLSHQANTGAATLQVNATIATAITKNGATALATGDIPNAAIIEWVYDGTQFELLSSQSFLPLGGGSLTGALNEAQATIASAGTVAIGAAAANYLYVSGTTTITAFDTVQAGTARTLKFQGALTLTNNGNIVLGSGANVLTVAGDIFTFRSEGAGVWREVARNRTKQPTRQVLTSGTAATYTRPAGCIRQVIRLVGGGGGGGASGTTPGAATDGSASTWTSGSLVASAGTHGTIAAGGGVAPTGAGTVNLAGATGGQPQPTAATTPGGAGGASVFGGAGTNGAAGNGGTAVANTGSGGGGAASSGTASAGGGGGAGAYIEYTNTAPPATETYTVGAGGTGGAAGTGGSTGGSGATGLIIVDEFYV